MSSIFDERLSSAPVARGNGSLRMPPPVPVNVPRIWRWIVRLVLPVLILLAGQVLYWIWFDNIYTSNWASVVGGCWIAFTMAIILVWLVCAWLATEEP